MRQADSVNRRVRRIASRRRLAAAVLSAGAISLCTACDTERPDEREGTTTAVVTEKAFPPFDFARWGRFIVRDFFKVQPYEKVVIMAAPSYYPELLDAIRAELLEARAIELGTILFDEREVAARRRAVTPRVRDPKYRAETDAARRNLYQQADIFIWLPFRYGTGDERDAGDRRELERLVEGTNARGLHFHWVTNPEPFTQEEINALSRAYADALDIDYAALSAHHDRLIAALSGRVLHITTPAGTDLRVRAGPRFHKGDGVMDRERAATARSVRDREMELPAGALRFIPDVTTTEGTLVVPAWSGGEGVRFEFQGGRIRNVTATTGEAQVREAWTRATGDKDRIGELVIGASPKLPPSGPWEGRRPPYYGYGAGVLRIAIGENWESGGTNRSSLETSFFFTDATITAGDTPIVTAGKLVLP